MNVIVKYTKQNMRLFFASLILMFTNTFQANAQVAQELRFMRVGDLQSYFSSVGAEVEYNRGAGFDNQADGMWWPAQYQIRQNENLASRGMWIGTTDFDDPLSGERYPYKIVAIGPRLESCVNPDYEVMPVVFYSKGRHKWPIVLVDNEPAAFVRDDVVDEIDETLKPDRLIYNELNTSIGLTVKRTIMAFSNPYHDDYFVKEYVLKNTGIYDLAGNVESKTLTDVVLHFQYRYSFGSEGNNASTPYVANDCIWGRNTVNDVIGRDPNATDFEMRAQMSWYGLYSSTPVDSWGAPAYKSFAPMAAVQYAGVVTMHADKSATEKSDDPNQPRTTQHVGSDAQINQECNSFNENAMTFQYEAITAGHSELTHAEEVGDGFANQFGGDNGGWTQGHGYGPYTLEPGDSVRIVVAEGVSGISREKNLEVSRKWYYETGEYDLPDGSTTSDPDEYKEMWVKTGRDSLMQVFRNAISNFENEYEIPSPPPPPSTFEVNSGGDRIVLSWADNATSYSNFDGYEVWRAIGKSDTTFEKIFSCDASNVTHRYEDTSARRGFDYYYYVSTKDGGSENMIEPGVPLTSSKFFTMTNLPAYLRRPAGTALSQIRIVPNPFHIGAKTLQFGDSAPDRIAFFGLPKECVIKIYTERGDLVDTIDHNDGSGDELWNCMTSSRQIIVSGIYIAYFEVTEDGYDDEGNLLYKKGESVVEKFSIIR